MDLKRLSDLGVSTGFFVESTYGRAVWWWAFDDGCGALKQALRFRWFGAEVRWICRVSS